MAKKQYFDIYDGPSQDGKRPLFNPLIMAGAALTCGILGLVAFFVPAYAAALFLGAVGIFAGGNSFGHGIKVLHQDKNYIPLTVSAAGLLSGVVAFMLGFAGVVA